ncbi:MAG: hypothetical protein ACLFWM_00245 [Actinomycetota bacterium]
MYRLLVKATLVAAVLLAAITSWTAVALETPALLPMIGLGIVSAAYAWWQISRSRQVAVPRTDGRATITSG